MPLRIHVDRIQSYTKIAKLYSSAERLLKEKKIYAQHDGKLRDLLNVCILLLLYNN
jgi:hypothetical protein